MRIFDTPYPYDYLFMKVAGAKQVVYLPLCEAVGFITGAVYDQKLSNNEQVVFIEKKPDGKTMKVPKKDLILKLQHDIYGDKFKIVDFIIQPEGEMQTAEVTQFLEKY